MMCGNAFRLLGLKIASQYFSNFFEVIGGMLVPAICMRAMASK